MKTVITIILALFAAVVFAENSNAPQLKIFQLELKNLEEHRTALEQEHRAAAERLKQLESDCQRVGNAFYRKTDGKSPQQLRQEAVREAQQSVRLQRQVVTGIESTLEYNTKSIEDLKTRQLNWENQCRQAAAAASAAAPSDNPAASPENTSTETSDAYKYAPEYSGFINEYKQIIDKKSKIQTHIDKEQKEINSLTAESEAFNKKLALSKNSLSETQIYLTKNKFKNQIKKSQGSINFVIRYINDHNKKLRELELNWRRYLIKMKAAPVSLADEVADNERAQAEKAAKLRELKRLQAEAAALKAARKKAQGEDDLDKQIAAARAQVEAAKAAGN